MPAAAESSALSTGPGTSALVFLGFGVDANEETVELFQGLLLHSLLRPVCQRLGICA